MKIQDLDFTLWVITDADVSGGRVHAEVVRLALEGGATAIQYRDKRVNLRMMLAVGRQLRELTREHGAALIVNDRPDLALALEADGVQVGPEDLPPDAVRKVVGPDMIIGVSVDHPMEAREAEAAGADYITARPVFPTRWNTYRRPVMGLQGLSEIVKAVNVPVLGAGGINMDNLPVIFQAGAAGPVVTAAIVGARDPREAAAEFRRAIDAHRNDGAQAQSTADAYGG